jgi:hypothetical protein
MPASHSAPHGRAQDIAALIAVNVLHVTFCHLQQHWLENIPELKALVADIIREEIATIRKQDHDEIRPRDDE